MALLNYLLIGAIVVAVIAYTGLPLLIFFTNRSPRKSEFEQIDRERILPTAQDWMKKQEELLHRLGFTTMAVLKPKNTPANIATYLILLSNRTAGDKAMIAAMYGLDQTGYTLGTRYAEFTTDFTDESEISTMNSSTPSVFRYPATKRIFRLPAVQDIEQLYQVHQEMVARHATTAAKKLPPAGEEITYLQEGMIRDYESQVANGRQYFDRESDSYRPTLIGAFLMTWPLLFPVKQIKAFVRDQQAQAIIRSVLDTAGNRV